MIEGVAILAAASILAGVFWVAKVPTRIGALWTILMLGLAAAGVHRINGEAETSRQSLNIVLIVAVVASVVPAAMIDLVRRWKKRSIRRRVS